MAILVVMFFSGSAFAQETEPTFEELIGDAKAAYESENYKEAIDLLLYAHRVQPNSRLLINVAKSYEKMEQCTEALVYYNAYLREAETEEALIDVAEAAVDAAEECEGYDENLSGRLIIKSEPRGAAILVDDTRVGVTPFEVAALPAGAHVVKLELEGYEPFEKKVTLAPRSDMIVEPKLARAVEPVATTTPEPTTPEPTVTAKSEPGVDTMVYVAAGIATVGVALLATGLYYDLSVIPDTDEQRNQFAVGSPEYQALSDERDSEATIALVGYIGGGLLAVGGGAWLVYQLMMPAQEKQVPMVDFGGGIDLHPVVTEGGGGLVLKGRFQ